MAANALAACWPLIEGSSALANITKEISSPRRAKAPGLSAITSAYFVCASATRASRSARASTPHSAAAALMSPRVVLIAIARRRMSEDRTCEGLAARPEAWAMTTALSVSPLASAVATSRRRLPFGRCLRQKAGGRPGVEWALSTLGQPGSAQVRWPTPPPLTCPCRVKCARGH